MSVYDDDLSYCYDIDTSLYMDNVKENGAGCEPLLAVVGE